MTDTGLSADVAASQERWRDGRRYLNDHRHDLSRWAARNLYADHLQVGPCGLLTRAAWMPPEPVPLENVILRWCDDTPAPEVDGTEPASADLRPLQQDGRRYASYGEALGALAKPRLFEDRPCYRLLDVAVEGQRAELSFGLGTYFDVMNTSEAVAHELADAWPGTAGDTPSLEELPFRALVGDPCDLVRRPLLPAISALTIRRTAADAAFVLHRRDSTKVAHGGGLYQVMPVGMFQPSATGAWNVDNDFDLWRCMVREYSEEFLGASEHQGCDGPLDYSAWPFYRSLTDGRGAGAITAYWLGLGVDPLRLVTDLLVAVVFDAEVFDTQFRGSVSSNAEGDVVGWSPPGGGIGRVPFTNDQVARIASGEPMQAAGASLLQLSWDHRVALLAG